MHVTETVVLRFGEGSGRHGLQVQLVTREPDGADYDMVYKIDQVTVSSPSGAPAGVQLTTHESGRQAYLQLRVGDPNTTVSAPTATYVLSYRAQGLLRNPGGVSQLYWDVTGSSTPLITSASVRVRAPGGVQAADCWVGVPSRSSQTRCADARIDADKVATFTSRAIERGELLTVAAKLAPGAVANTEPIREPNAEKALAEQMAWAFSIASATFWLSLAGAVLMPFVGWWQLRRLNTDLRFAGLPPGVLPPEGDPARVVRSDPKLEIPVAFSPPEVSVAEAGYLLDGSLDSRDTTATLVQLAVSGAIVLRTDGGTKVGLINRANAPDRSSRALLRELFPEAESEASRTFDLGEPGTLVGGHAVLSTDVAQTAAENGWYHRAPERGRDRASLKLFGELFLGAMVAVVVAVVGVVILTAFFPPVGIGVGLVLLAMLPMIVSILITRAVVKKKSQVGQRSAVGRALTDQIQGFRTYLATAEAEQLRFEEGEDIFSRYLPWAVVFDLTDRWTRICARLIELGRVPSTPPTWYLGSSWRLSDFGSQLDVFNSSVHAASYPAPVTTSSFSSADTGFGSSGSGFDSGGGFSGGGSGGSNMSSW